MCVIKLMENNAWQNLYYIPYLPETPISARGLKARGLYLSSVNMGCDTNFDLHCCFYNILNRYLVSFSCVKLILIYLSFPFLESGIFSISCIKMYCDVIYIEIYMLRHHSSNCRLAPKNKKSNLVLKVQSTKGVLEWHNKGWWYRGCDKGTWLDHTRGAKILIFIK